MKLKGKTAIVTGSTSGIGRTIAEVLAGHGANVIVCGRNLARGEKVAERITAGGGKAMAFKLDISVPSEVDALVQRTIEAFGAIDILVNNAAYLPGTSMKPFHEEDPAEWDNHINITLKGTLYMCRAVIPHMIGRRGGRIINITTVAAKVGQPTGPFLYPGCKAAVAAVSRCLAGELGRYGITVNCVAPGPVKTENLLGQPKEFLDKIAKPIPLKRMGEPEEIAHLVAFLASDEAAFITGQHISADGGLSPF